MENRVDFEQLTYSILEKAGYSRNDLGKVHNSTISGIRIQGEVREQDFYSEHFQAARYYEDAQDITWQRLSLKYGEKIVKLEENEGVSALELRVDKDHHEKIEMPDLSIDSLTLQICGLLGIKPKESSADEKSEYDSKK